MSIGLQHIFKGKPHGQDHRWVVEASMPPGFAVHASTSEPGGDASFRWWRGKRSQRLLL